MYSDVQMQVRQLVQQAATGKALDILSDYVEQNNLTAGMEAVLILKAKYASLKEDFEIRGVVNRQDFDLGMNQINVGIINLLGKLEPGKHPPSTPVLSQRLMPVIAVFALLAGVVIWWISSLNGPRRTGSESVAPDSTGSVYPTISLPPATESLKASPELTRSPQSGPRNPPAPKPDSKTASFDISLVINAEWSEAAVLIDGKEAEIVQKTLNIIKIRVQEKDGPHTIALKMDGQICEQKRLVAPDAIITFNCDAL